jgi:hypothetical protein
MKTLEYLTPLTLARICADIWEQEPEDTEVLRFAQAVLFQLAAIVGKEQALEMIEKAT